MYSWLKINNREQLNLAIKKGERSVKKTKVKKKEHDKKKSSSNIEASELKLKMINHLIPRE